MKRFQLPALLIAGVMFVLAACEREDRTLGNVYKAKESQMTGAQVTPPSNSTATGTINGEYNEGTQILSYRINWSGLSGAVDSIHIHGPAEPGFRGPTLTTGTPITWATQRVIGRRLTFSSIDYNAIATAGTTYGVSGTFSGTLFVDETMVKETNILSNKYYVVIFTKNYPAGEIRGQITF